METVLYLACFTYCEQYAETTERDAIVYEAFEIYGNPLQRKGLHDFELADYLEEWGFPLCTEWETEL